ncbi:hypothetical protein SNE40_009300 [Patella caerulea]|uniref:Uncharacterized protein n=1 Tax=Patella caerulea TaxID=87958 RepID=A0AAN8PQG9_PATCE
MLASVSEISPNSSYGSSSSSIQSEAANARAKAKAAKTRLSFMEKEAKLKQQKAVIETELDVIAAEKDAAIAVAEAGALEAYWSSRRSRSSLISLPSENKSTRTKNYVETVQSQKRPTDSSLTSHQQDVHVAERVTLKCSAF